MKILIIEDEIELANSIIEFVEKDYSSLDSAENFELAEEKINIYEYDCALIDLMLPDGSGLDLIELLKRKQPKCGIIVITAKDTLDDKLQGLNLGADDYLTKPFHLAELNARINSVIRRKNFDGSDIIELKEIKINNQTHEVFVNDKLIELTRREYDILMFFIGNKNRVLTKASIVEHVWGDDANAFDNFDFVYTHIKNLRKKILNKGGNDYFKSIYGVGYKLSLE